MKQHTCPPANSTLAEITQHLDSGTKQGFATAVELALAQVLSNLHVKENFDLIIHQVREEPWYQNLEVTWGILKPEVRARQWKTLMSQLIEMAYSSRPYCVRCGECCLHGSPSLHLEDSVLLAQGILSPKDLYTLRKGEPAKLNVEGRLGLVQQELIKVREKPENGQCIFYVEHGRKCAIYEHRPLQCQVQECWDPESLKKLWQQDKLSRRHLLQDDQTLQKLVHIHNERCSPEELDAIFNRILQDGDETALDRVLEMLRYDTTFRATLMEKGGFRVEELDFFFGRSLQEIVRAYGVRVEKDEDGTYHLVSDV